MPPTPGAGTGDGGVFGTAVGGDEGIAGATVATFTAAICEGDFGAVSTTAAVEDGDFGTATTTAAKDDDFGTSTRCRLAWGASPEDIFSAKTLTERKLSANRQH